MRSLESMWDLLSGDHVCAIYEDDGQRDALVRDFLISQLSRGRRVICIRDTPLPPSWSRHAAGHGLSLEERMQQGQLYCLRSQDTYLKDQQFDPEVMIQLLGQETQRAANDGYPGLSITGEAEGAFANIPGSDRWVEYEVRVNQFIPGSSCIALCLYDARLFDPQQLVDVLRTHPWAILNGVFHENIFFVPPAQWHQPDRHQRVYEHLLQTLRKHRQVENSRVNFQHRLEEEVRQRTHELQVSESKARELAQHHELLLREVNHRVKNNLSAILALISLTSARARTPEQWLSALQDRVMSISQAHDLLSRSHRENIQFKDLADRVLSAMAGEALGNNRILLHGSIWQLSTRMATPLALILQELLTNSIKHGALSNHVGKVEISWQHQTGEAWQLCWQERNGPVIRQNLERGLGLDIINGLAERDLAGKVDMQFHATGLVCQLHIPSARDSAKPMLLAQSGISQSRPS